MKLLNKSETAQFAAPAAAPGMLGGLKATLGKGLGHVFNAANTLMMPAMIAPMFIPGADTRAQEHMLEEVKKNPRLGLPFKVPGLDPETLQEGKVTIGNPTPNVRQPGELPPGSLR